MWDVVIVGAGPAGLSAALFLAARAPHLAERTLVLEKASHPRDKICAGAIGDRAERALRAIGVDVEVPSCSIRGIAVTTLGGTLMVRSPSSVGRVVRRHAFDAELALFARKRGIALREGTSVRSIVNTGDAVVIETDGEPLRARVVIGADGVGSVIRRESRIARGDLIAQVAEVDTERAPRDLDCDVVHFDLSDRSLSGYAWDFPTPLHGRISSCRGVYDLRVSARANGPDVSWRLRARCDTLQTLGPVKRFSERGISWNQPMARERTLLIGEAAGIDPILGEGIAQAILYGKCAADYLVPKLAEDALDFADWRSFVKRSRLGLDLSARALAIPFVYGPGRSTLERWVTGSRSLAQVGLDYFGGRHVRRSDLARATGDLAKVLLGQSIGL